MEQAPTGEEAGRDPSAPGATAGSRLALIVPGVYAIVSVASGPKFIVPRHSRLTRSPVLPRRVVSIPQ